MRKLKTYETLNLVNYAINRIVPKQYRELERTLILAKLKEITKLTKSNLTQQQVLEIAYKHLGVDTIWLNFTQYMKQYLLKMKLT